MRLPGPEAQQPSICVDRDCEFDWPAVWLAITAPGVLASGRLGVIAVLLGCALLGVKVRIRA